MRIPLFAFFLCVGGAAQADVPRVATDVAPVHGLVARVMQGLGSPDLVIPPGASPHGYAMRPSEARALSNAQIVFWVGSPLTPWLADPLETLATDAKHITLSSLPDVKLLEYRSGARFAPHAHDDHHGHEEAGHEEHDEMHAVVEKDDHDGDHGHAAEHAHGNDHALDGHLWLHPENAMLWLDVIAAELSAHDADNAALYEKNAAEAREEITALSAALELQLSGLQDRPFIVFHDAYHYFEARFGLSAAAAVTLGDESGAGAGHLAEVREVVSVTGAVCALAEPRANAGLIAAVTEGNGLRIATVDSIGVGLPLGPDYYLALLSQIADELVACLSEN